MLKGTQGPYLEIGPGTGFITEIIPTPLICVESDTSRLQELKKYTVIWSKIQSLNRTSHSLLQQAQTCVSNLPFDQSIGILLHCYHEFLIRDYIVILQQEVADKILKSCSVLSHKINHLFEVLECYSINSSSFNPKPKTDATLLKLRVKKHDKGYLAQLNLINQPRKKLKNNGIKWGCDYRIDQLSLEEAYAKYLESNPQ